MARTLNHSLVCSLNVRTEAVLTLIAVLTLKQ